MYTRGELNITRLAIQSTGTMEVEQEEQGAVQTVQPVLNDFIDVISQPMSRQKRQQKYKLQRSDEPQEVLHNVDL